MRKQRVLVIQTKKVTSHSNKGPVIETINNKQVVGQSYEKFCKFIGSHGYMSAEILKVTDVIVKNNKTSLVEVTGEEFDNVKANFMEFLKDTGITYGNQIAADPNNEKVNELSSKVETMQSEIDAHSELRETLETKENELSDIQQENEELKSKVEESEAKDQELIELKKKLAALTPKSIDDMTIQELQDHINDKGYIIPLAQNKAELIAAIKEAETNA